MPHTLEAFWEARAESPAALTRRLVRFFQDITAIHPRFSRWYKVRKSSAETMARAVDPSPKPVRTLIERSWDRLPVPGSNTGNRSGTKLLLTNQTQCETLSIRAGYDWSTGDPHDDGWIVTGNCLECSVPFKQAKLAERLARAVISTWDPRWLTVSTDRLYPSFPGWSVWPNVDSPPVEWMIYLAKRRWKPVTKLEDARGVRSIPLPRGVLHITSQRPPDVTKRKDANRLDLIRRNLGLAPPYVLEPWFTYEDGLVWDKGLAWGSYAPVSP